MLTFLSFLSTFLWLFSPLFCFYWVCVHMHAASGRRFLWLLLWIMTYQTLHYNGVVGTASILGIVSQFLQIQDK